MLQNQPLEIVITISHYLDFNDKLELIKTCQRLHDAISNTSLFEILNLLVRCRNPVKTIQYFEENPTYGSRVKILLLDTTRLDDELFFRLPFIFPNVTKFTVHSKTQIELNANKAQELSIKDHTKEDGWRIAKYGISDPMLQWIHNFDSYDAEYDWCWTGRYLENHALPLLHEIRIDGLYHSHGRNEDQDNQRFNMRNFLPYLRNAPSLTRLYLYDCDMILEILQSVHECCPHIESLMFDLGSLTIKPGDFPESIIPANNVSVLSINNLYLQDKSAAFLDYILVKYPKVQRLDFRPTLAIYISEESDDEEEEQSTINITEAYRENGIKFLSNLPKSLKQLKIDSSIFRDVLSALGLSDIKLFSLELQSFCGTFHKVNQLEYLIKQTHLKNLSVKFCPSTSGCKQKFFSTSITKLNLYLEGDEVSVDWVLSMFCSLEDLCIRSWKPINSGPFKLISTSHTSYPNLLFLDLSNHCAHPSLFKYIKAVAPNLKKLLYPVYSTGALQESNISLESDQIIDFTNWNLRQCNLVMRHKRMISYNVIYPKSDRYEVANFFRAKKLTNLPRVKLIPSSIHKIYCIVTNGDMKKEIIIPSAESKIDIPPANRQYENAKKTEIADVITKVDIIFHDNLQLNINGFSFIKADGALVVDGVENNK